MAGKENNHHKESSKQPPREDTEKTITMPEAEYSQLKGEAEKAKEYWDRLLRLQADFDNARKRLEKDKSEFLKYANEGIIVDLLNILDDLERAVNLVESKHEDSQAFIKGVEMILAHLYEMLKDHGVKAIDVNGKPFDPNYHEALMQVDKDDVPEHTVVEELQKGYLLNDRVIRTSKVKVSKRTENREQRTEGREQRTEGAG